MKWIRFTMSKGDNFSLSIEKAEQILNAESQIVKINDDKGWTGETINKAHIVSTQRDFDKEKTERLNVPQIEEGKRNLTQEEQGVIEERKKEIAKMLK